MQLKNLRLYQLRALLAETEALRRRHPVEEGRLTSVSPFHHLQQDLKAEIEQLDREEHQRMRRMLFDVVLDALSYTPWHDINMDDIVEALTRAHNTAPVSKKDVWDLSEFLRKKGYSLFPSKGHP